MCIVNILLVSNDDKIVASTEGGNGSNGDNNGGINLTYVWEITQQMANVIYDAYPPGDIPKGRSFGSKGGNYTVYQILKPEMDINIGLEDVHTEQIKHINDPVEIKKNYTSIINMIDFQITINNDDYPYENPVPKTEMYVIPNGFPYTDLGELTGNNTLEDVEILQNNMTLYWPLAGTYNDYHFNITQENYDNINNINGLIIGNVTYLQPNDPPPNKESQYGRVYLLDDTQGCQDKIDNLTIANAGIIIDDGSKGLNYANTQNCPFPAISIDDTDGNTIKELLENYTVLVDNVTGNLTFTYNLGVGWWPPNPHIFIDRIPDHFEITNITLLEGPLIKAIACSQGHSTPTFGDYVGCVAAKSLIWRLINPYKLYKCKGIVLYDSYDYHFMICTFNYWIDEPPQEQKLINFSLNQTKYGPSLPVFTLNQTIGSWLLNHRQTTTLTGYANQELTIETTDSPGVEAYNVIGNITIDKSPDDAIFILTFCKQEIPRL